MGMSVLNRQSFHFQIAIKSGRWIQFTCHMLTEYLLASIGLNINSKGKVVPGSI